MSILNEVSKVMSTVAKLNDWSSRLSLHFTAQTVAGSFLSPFRFPLIPSCIFQRRCLFCMVVSLILTLNLQAVPEVPITG